ncbi:MAG: hypothetical protein LBT48_00535 [Prevotellaceae bacterium]|jgi:hypothetical protein|nr:hypothetical protein [Prevotellaceae bacterium]
MKYITIIFSIVSLALFVLLAALDAQGAMVAYQLAWTYLLLGAAAVSAAVFPLIHFFRNPPALKKAMAYAGALSAVCIIAVLWSSAEPAADAAREASAAAWQWADICIAVTCILFAAATAAVVAGSILHIKRNN